MLGWWRRGAERFVCYVRSQSRCWVAVQPRDGVGWYDVDTRSQEPIEWRPLPPGGMRMGDGEGEV
jgi:hypothetical protein